MSTTISSSLIAQLKPTGKQYEVRDSKLTGFLIRVNATGKMMYVCEYKRGKRISLGKVGVLSPKQARDRAKEIIGDAAKGINLKLAKKQQQISTLKAFIENEYRSWVCAHRKRGVETIARITTNFLSTYGHKALVEVDAALIEKWRSKRLQAGKKISTVNRDVVALRAALSKAVEWGLIENNPLAKVKPLKTDILSRIRYLKPDEEQRLRQALITRDEELKAARERANQWRRARHQPELPSLVGNKYADYLAPMVLISLNTGLRRGELLSLNWEQVNLERKVLSVMGETAKSGKTRHVPLNTEATQVLQCWRQQSNGIGVMFPGHGGKAMTECKKAWKSLLSVEAANIVEFRWHDMRHHFASKLVMAGVDLNTVRELLGHSDIKMTLRYAHLAPEHKANAVEKLVSTKEIISFSQVVLMDVSN